MRRAHLMGEPGRCTATSKTHSTRCKQPAIAGGTVCHYHGGAAPQVKRAAAERLLAMVDPALDAFDRALVHKDIHAAIRVARDVLDRAGHGAPTKVEHSGTVSLVDLVDD